MPTSIMTANQVAKLLQVSRDTVYQLATRGELRGRKVGRIWRFSTEAIDAFMHDGTGARPADHNPAPQPPNDSNEQGGMRSR